MVIRLENLLQTLYAYFSKSLKRHLEFSKLAEIMETQGNKLLKNVKTWWISMLEPTKRVMSEYHTLVVKMALDSTNNNSAKVNFELLCDIEVLYGLAILLPMWEKVDSLMKLAQAWDGFVVDYVAVIKLC
jgi:hypothetical protein